MTLIQTCQINSLEQKKFKLWWYFFLYHSKKPPQNLVAEWKMFEFFNLCVFNTNLAMVDLFSAHES